MTMSGIFRFRRKGLRTSVKPREAAQFFVNWLAAPRMMGAVAPSSHALARAMAQEVDRKDGYVIEMGGGTGSITAGLLESGISPERLIVIERDPGMFKTLRMRFPNVRVLLGDAAEMRKLVAPFGVTKAAAIVSCIPLVTVPEDVRDSVIRESMELLQDNGPIIQFTYSPFAPLEYRKYGLAGRVTARVWLNLPPAVVWRFERKTAQK
jgi:phosphatidylethanolamine/phosphatidyl-N-methylethanolamine N-methyltransferase